LGLGITVGLEKPGHIKTILSGHWPIFIDYGCMCIDITGSALWRMRAMLKHQDRVRRIAFEGGSNWFDEFFKATNCPFPVLESLVLGSRFRDRLEFPDTFLGGLGHLHLRYLTLTGFYLTATSRILSSAKALTDLVLQVDTVFGPSPGTSLLACLQGMPCLRSLCLFTSYDAFKPPSQPSESTPNASLSKLTRFRYDGHSTHLNALARLSAPYLRDVNIHLIDAIQPPNVNLSRFINEIEENYTAVHVEFQQITVRISFLTQSEYTRHCEPRFRLSSNGCPREFIMRMSGVLSARLTTVEQLCVTFDRTAWDGSIALRKFLQQFSSVKALRIRGANTNDCIVPFLIQDREEPGDYLPFLPALEEIDLGKNTFLTHESERAREPAVFQPFVSARQQEGRPVKVFFGS
jgi:hypothetical protein